MKKETIFDLWEAQHKEDQKRQPERIENEVQPADLEEEKEIKPEPEKKEVSPEPAGEAPAATPEEGKENGV